MQLNADFAQRVVLRPNERSWLRSPRWSQHTPYTQEEDALIYLKVGHLGASFLTPPKLPV